MDDEKLFGEAQEIVDEVLNKQECEERVVMLMNSGGKVIEIKSRINDSLPSQDTNESQEEPKQEETFEPSPLPQTDFMEDLVKMNALTKEVSRLRQDNSDILNKLQLKESDLADSLSEIDLLSAEKGNLLKHYNDTNKKYETLFEEYSAMKEEFDFMKIENDSIHKNPYALPQGSTK